MKKYILSGFVCIFLILFSCSRDIKFDLPDVESLVVIHSFVDPDIKNQIIVTMARSVQKPTIQMSMDCQVDLYENDIFLKRLDLDTMLYYDLERHNLNSYLGFKIDSNPVFSEGNIYKVEVNYAGYETVSAETIMPETPVIKDITTRHFAGEMPDWYYNTPWKLLPQYTGDLMERDTSLIEFTVTFDDPAGIDNFYRIGVNLISTLPWPRNLFNRRIQYAVTSDPDPCFMRYEYYSYYPLHSGWSNPTTYEILWNDKYFDGEENPIKILVPSGGRKYVISLYSLSEDYYKYMVSEWKYYKIENDPFAEPVRFHDNTSNGCGIFALSAVDIDTIVF